MSLFQTQQDTGVKLANGILLQKTTRLATKAIENSENASATASDQTIHVGSDSKDQTTLKTSGILLTTLRQAERVNTSMVDNGVEQASLNKTETDKSTTVRNTAGEGVTEGVTVDDCSDASTDALLSCKVAPNSNVTESSEATTKGSHSFSNHLADNSQKFECQHSQYALTTPHNNDEHCYASGGCRSEEVAMTKSKEEDKANDYILCNSTGAKNRRSGLAELENRREQKLEYCTTVHKAHSHCVTTNLAMTEDVGNVEETMEQQEIAEALDLSLPKTKERKEKEKRCEWVLDDPENEGLFLMEVDEIEDDMPPGDVVQEDDDETEISLSHVGSFNMNIWEIHPSISPRTSIPSPCCSSLTDIEPEETLLIDDQGIPYTLDSDGQKIPQTDPSVLTEDLLKQSNPNTGQVKDHTNSSAKDIDIPGLKQGLLLDSSIEPSDNLASSDVSSSVPSKTTQKMNINSSHASPAVAISSASPLVSSLPSHPIQIVTNTSSNSPILVLPRSQLQALSTTATNPNPGLMTLSLPLSLTQNPSSSPVVLVLSSVAGSSTQSPSLSTPLAVISTSSGSGQLAQMPAAALPLTSSMHDLGATSQSTYSLLGLKPVTSAPAVKPSGKNTDCNLSLAPTSQVASSTTPVVTCPNPADAPLPTSFREALLRLATEHQPENQPKRSGSPSVQTSSSSPDTSQMHSPTSTPGLSTNHSLDAVPSPNAEPVSSSVDTVDTMSDLASTEDIQNVSSTSPLRPISPIFPTNHPKNPDSSVPRRILYCQYCPRVFYYLSDLERHSITHSQSKPHVCQLCGKAFKRSSHLERHKHIHTGQRNFACPICGKRFRESGELIRHQRVHTGEKPFQCLLCHMRFAERNTLRRHNKRKHQGQEQEAIDKDIDQERGRLSLVSTQGQQEESAEWYSSTVTEMDSENDTDGD